MRTLLLVLLMIGAVVLYLSRKPSRWPGLILPAIAFLISLIYPLSMVNLGGSTSTLVTQALLVWLLANIPTAILLVIYASGRGRARRMREQDKMRAQDL